MFNIKKPSSNVRVCAIVVSAGNSSRMKSDVNKQFIEILGIPIVAYSLLALQNCASINEIVIVTREQDILIMSDIVREYEITKATNVIVGGSTRQESVQNGLSVVENADIIAVHDGARPCILSDDIEKAILRAKQCGAAALAFPATDTLKVVDGNGCIVNTLDRSTIWHMQTPQVFESSIIRKAYKNAIDNEICATDDCMLVEMIGENVYVIEGSPNNIKVTTSDDIDTATGILSFREKN